MLAFLVNRQRPRLPPRSLQFRLARPANCTAHCQHVRPELQRTRPQCVFSVGLGDAGCTAHALLHPPYCTHRCVCKKQCMPPLSTRHWYVPAPPVAGMPCRPIYFFRFCSEPGPVVRQSSRGSWPGRMHGATTSTPRVPPATATGQHCSCTRYLSEIRALSRIGTLLGLGGGRRVFRICDVCICTSSAP